MIRKNTALAGLAAIGVGALLLAGCASTPNTSSSESPTQEQLPLVGYEQVAASDLADGGELNLAVTSTPTDEGSWNPNHAAAQNVDVQQVLEPTLGYLVIPTEDGSWQVDKNYATSVELTSEDPQIVTVKLNEDAVWQDGSPLTANDYAATFAALRDTESGYETIPSAVFQAIDSVDVANDYEFSVTFAETFADWPNLLQTPPLPAAVASDVNSFNTAFTSAPAPSNGPFIFDKIDNDAKIFTLIPNPNWWGEKPKLDTITFKVIAQEALPQAFANDEIDYMEILTPDALETATSKDGAVIQRSGGLTWSHLTFNGKSAPFDDVNVRKAVGMALDRELIARVANEPLGAPATTTGDWIFMPGQEGYEDHFGDIIGHDLDKAATLLEDSGWKHEDGEWTKDGKTLTFSVTVPAGTESNINRALGVQDSLKALDIEVTLDQVPSAEYFNNIGAGKFQSVTFGWQGTLFPISSAQPVFYPEMEFGDENGYNYAFISDDRLGPLWEKANKELDETKRIEIAQEINEVIADYLPMVPIYPYPEVVATDKGLANFGTATFKSTDWSLVGYLK
ncbi:ABC transporter family substrate-binding protein [Microbacterium ulmi]|uniref:ABC transporter family substrate-binding protein n=1 Tax=Microbacterium ulmi TaxID=179095 RepID=A0A7Y2Q1T6_9MICO|nr:ABC transporter family substrate-binding protein [Microbacterium ulmi]NII71419.1 peptide/nickel transport system substrate-binding protein [Microbacterium ulmi]NNH04677.1 ABC transporter family substrate-binding protein [Microbacterium ulmi]